MYPIGTKPFLQYSVDNLLASDAFDLYRDTVTLVVGHHSRQVVDYFGELYPSLSVRFVTQSQQLGTGHAVSLALPEDTEPLVVWLGDVYVSRDMFESVVNQPDENTVTLFREPVSSKEDYHANYRVDVDGDRVTRVWKGRSPYVEIGLWKLTHTTAESMTRSKGDEYRALMNLDLLIQEGLGVRGIFVSDWLQIGYDVPSSSANVLRIYNELNHRGELV